MPTVTLNLRNDPAHLDEIELDDLTPKARALALAIAASELHTPGLIHAMHESGETRPWRGWAHQFPRALVTTPSGYLEIEARAFPPDWQIPTHDRTRLPGQWVIEHADDLVDRDGALTRLRARGIRPSHEEFRARTSKGDMPRPARHVSTGGTEMPLWSAADLDTWAREHVVTTTEAAPLMGVRDAPAARRKLDRWGVQPIFRQPGRDGQNLYDTAEIRERVAQAPGRGARTDLT
ncbi:hypothetical protein CFN78_06805 [Amycolatopsis antarctica]|uniref:Uncharacterized protein n=1 Tax=Amycolatopsis antarctica TaxID=1854586 RepID=A0A263D651_9PSEU|nr:hypothetical protein [Amycolatopsis antarctica]OZM73992.1 hypothetical protein CFN78_06805 [Amycolatopsis antarctica]